MNENLPSDSSTPEDNTFCLLPFSAPTTMAIFGSTLSGKTTWCRKLLENADNMFDRAPDQILYCYGIYQPMFEILHQKIPNLQLHCGLPSMPMLEDLTATSNHSLLILDDLQQEMATNALMEKLFTQLAHHLNLSVIFMGNNMFQKNFSRTIIVNVHVLILFKNSRDAQQVRALARQIFPVNADQFANVYFNVTQEPYGYLVVDLSPSTCEALRVRTNIFPGEYPFIWKM